MHRRFILLAAFCLAIVSATVAGAQTVTTTIGNLPTNASPSPLYYTVVDDGASHTWKSSLQSIVQSVLNVPVSKANGGTGTSSPAPIATATGCGALAYSGGWPSQTLTGDFSQCLSSANGVLLLSPSPSPVPGATFSAQPGYAAITQTMQVHQELFDGQSTAGHSTWALVSCAPPTGGLYYNSSDLFCLYFGTNRNLDLWVGDSQTNCFNQCWTVLGLGDLVPTHTNETDTAIQMGSGNLLHTYIESNQDGNTYGHCTNDGRGRYLDVCGDSSGPLFFIDANTNATVATAGVLPNGLTGGYSAEVEPLASPTAHPKIITYRCTVNGPSTVCTFPNSFTFTSGTSYTCAAPGIEGTTPAFASYVRTSATQVTIYPSPSATATADGTCTGS